MIVEKIMNKILHLERKFTSSTETFIVNQINTLINFKHFVFTIVFLDNLKSNANIIYPLKKKKWYDIYFLTYKNKIHFLKQYELLKPNIIHSHYLTDASFFHPFTKKLNIPKICSCYGYDVSHFPKKYNIFSKRIFK